MKMTEKEILNGKMRQKNFQKRPTLRTDTLKGRIITEILDNRRVKFHEDCTVHEDGSGLIFR
jgi:hypothetical protein